jgi:hypothetical protein
MSTNPMKNSEKENDVIKQILYNNKYDLTLLNKYIIPKNKKKMRRRKNRQQYGQILQMLVKKQNSLQNYLNILVSKSPLSPTALQDKMLTNNKD